MKRIRLAPVAAFACFVLLVGCGSAPEPGSASAATGDPATVPSSAPAPSSAPGPSRVPAPSGVPAPARERPLRPVPPAARAASRSLGSASGASVGFALHISGDVAAFDPRTGAELGRYVFGRVLEDVCWDARTGRVLIVEHDAYADGSRVHALSWDGSHFVHESSSPVLPGHSRVFAASDRVYAVSEEQGVVWNVLDDDLAPVGQFEPLVRPVSLLEIDDGAPSRLLALDSSSQIAEQPADTLLGIAHPGSGWQITEQSYLAPGRPSARMVPGKPGFAYVLHKDPGEGTIELARLSTSAPDAPPDFHVVMTGAGSGELEGAAYDPDRRVVVVALSRVPIARLALVPVATGRPAGLVSLGAALDAALWWPRDLVRDRASGRILVATLDGLRAFAPAGGAAQPNLVPDLGFAAPDLRGPIALAR